VHWNYHGTPFPDGFGILMLPDSGAGHFETAKRLIQGFQPDIYFTLYDVFVSGPFMAGLSKKSNGDSKTKWLSYFVWDTERWSAPRSYQGFFDRCDMPVAMSQYGRDTVLEAYGVECPYVYHGVDFEQFKPLPFDMVNDRREKYGNPDIIIGGFFRNIYRKETVLLLEAWSRVSREYRDAQLLLNMRVDDPQGFDLVTYLHHFNLLSKADKDGNLLEQGPVRIGQQSSPLQGVPVQELNLLYQVCDAQVLPTRGEGFGKPIIEGYAASGLPVIMTHNTTYDELVGDHGLPIETNGYTWSSNAGAQTLPNIESLENQLRVMIDDANLRKKFSDANKEFVKDFSYDEKIIPAWLELLEKNA
jgi:glycosyltransferase involved in cell wall biosynthesis